MNTTLASLTQTPLWSVDIDDTLAHVEQLFATQHLSWAPVLEGGRGLIGVISLSDLLQFRAQGRDPALVRAWQLCTYKPIGVERDTPLADVARRMVEQRIHHVVVTDAGVPVGALSALDFVRCFATAG